MKNPIKLLIADSNIELLTQMKTFFDGKDDINLIGTATDGMEAAEKIREYRPGVVIMDIVLPQMDGIGLLKSINTLPKAHRPIVIITSGAKTAVALAESNIRTFCTGGQMIIHSFSYVGKQAEDFVKNVNADILFFSCHGLDEKGRMTDNAIEEANIRRVMFEQSEKKILLCDSSKLGKTYFYNMGNISDIDDVISDVDIFHILHSTNT